MMPPAAPLPLLTEILQRGDALAPQQALDGPALDRASAPLAPVQLSQATLVQTLRPAAPTLDAIALDALAARLVVSLQPELERLLRQALAADPVLRQRG